MSTWISNPRRLGGLLICLGALAACQPVSGLAALAGPKSAITLLGGDFTVKGPGQYCPDPTTVSETEDTAAVVLGRCAEDAKATPAILTVTVGPEGSGGVMAAGGAELASLFTSSTGRSMLSARGRAADIRVLKALERDGVIYLHLADRGAAPYWRGMAGMAGRLVTISARGDDLTVDDGFDLVATTVRTIRRANPGP